MKKGTKIILAISAVLAIGAGIFIYTSSKSKREAEEARIAAEELAKAQAGRNSPNVGSTGGGSAGTQSSVSTGFKNKAEGDAFRAWVNNKYPAYAKSIVLSKTGDYDNSYIRKAYAKYGAEYKLSLVKPHLLAKQYLGTSGKVVGDTTVVDFNGGKNIAIFYSNNRFVISRKGGSGYLSKGNYLYGGRVLDITDGVNKGKKYYASNKADGSVLSNLVSAL